jgi:hypothetical protein
MTLTRLSLQLWILAACGGAAVSPQPGQPPPSPSPLPVAPVATTLEGTESQLREDLERAGSNQTDRRFVTTYYVNDRTGIDLLTDWFERQKGVAGVHLSDAVSQTRVQGAGSRDVGALDIAEEEWWALEVEGPLKPLGPDDVSAWLQLLRAVPSDARWRLGPSIVSGR